MPKSFAPALVCFVVALAPLPFGLLAVALLAAASSTVLSAGLELAVRLLLVAVAPWCLVVTLQYLPAGSIWPAGSGWDEARQLLGDHPLSPKLAAYGEVPIAATGALVLALLAGLVCGRWGPHGIFPTASPERMVKLEVET